MDQPMKRLPGLLLVTGVAGCGDSHVNALERLGGKISRDQRGAVICVSLHDTGASDEDMLHVVGLISLRTLVLSQTRVSDTGLKHLAGLTNLKVLGLEGTKITDTGLVHLRSMTKLEWLFSGRQPGQRRGPGRTEAGVAQLSGRELTAPGQN
jgi:hypothetical protein